MLPIFMNAQPSDLYFVWEVEVQINNFRKFGYSERMHILVYDIDPEDPARIEYRKYWDRLQERYPEVKIFFYPDLGIKKILSVYIPLLQPHIIAQHFEANPWLEKEIIFYHDADMLFIKPFDFSPYMHDDGICYLSDTNCYLNASYFDSKVKDVCEDKLERYKSVDILQQVTQIVGINREIAEKNNLVSGGAQHILKGLNADYWRKVQQDSLPINIHLTTVNKTFFPSQEKGFQSWTAGMWSLLWNLWLIGKETQCPPEMNFCWATCPIERWDQHAIYHNAGVLHDRKDLFYKGDPRFKGNILTPFDLTEADYAHVSTSHCSWHYVQEILGVQDPVARKLLTPVTP